MVAVVAFWLVFSLVRKVFGLLLLASIAAGAWVLWSNPEMAQAVMESTARFIGWG